MFFINAASGVPIYEQLIHNVAQLTETGVLKPDDRLPSVRRLATDLGINPNTVAKAYRELEARGYTYSVAGKGSFIRLPAVGEPPPAEAAALRDFQNACRDAYKRRLSKEQLQGILNEVYEGGMTDD